MNLKLKFVLAHMEPMERREALIQVVVLGDPGAGKSSLALRFMTGNFVIDLDPHRTCNVEAARA